MILKVQKNILTAEGRQKLKWSIWQYSEPEQPWRLHLSVQLAQQNRSWLVSGWSLSVSVSHLPPPHCGKYWFSAWRMRLKWNVTLAISQHWFLIAPCLATARGGALICGLEMEGMRGSRMGEHPQSPGWAGTSGCEGKAEICSPAQNLWYEAMRARMICRARWEFDCAALQRVCLQSLNYPALQKVRHVTKGSLVWAITVQKLAVAQQKKKRKLSFCSPKQALLLWKLMIEWKR